ncbi:MAG: glutathione peroxidase [Bacteroidia bacterium]
MITLSNTAHDFSFTSIDGKEIKLSQFKGKKLLLVNTASQCGFTPQYEELQELHKKYKDKLVVIGFPCNDFGEQEPGSEKDIKSFCQKNYGVTFLLSEKISVKYENIDPLFKWLTEQKNTAITGDVMWNFEKFLIDENGNLIDRYRSTVLPTSEKITKHLN